MSPRNTPRFAAALIAAAIATMAFAQSAGAAGKVNMERLLIAAQLDEYRVGNHTTPGAVKSVKRVQRALRRKHIRVAVDGNFGAPDPERLRALAAPARATPASTRAASRARPR